eukprot:5773076-Pleurochrysis_carterae.AAC.1
MSRLQNGQILFLYAEALWRAPLELVKVDESRGNSRRTEQVVHPIPKLHKQRTHSPSIRASSQRLVTNQLKASCHE